MWPILHVCTIEWKLLQKNTVVPYFFPQLLHCCVIAEKEKRIYSMML